ncbi:hypothetical protein [Sandaracinus amylolyticus]|uniref:hypothetical protein n=1 Tax=Sandaracinus amylolyticus TaxID=927083 RepID=UPI001F45FCDB|nr:hypothetical protein [Sandaracinus amylolyticus]UJR83242.1 Hypothetical protein I5071_53090 [Sandaracinus amylolyticus]
MADGARQRPLVLRWTIGNVSAHGYDVLRRSLHGALRVFGPDARYVVCVNTVPLSVARARAGAVPALVEWLDVSGMLDARLRPHLDAALTEGTSWKFAPVRLAPDAYELALDNDCVLWRMPDAIRTWLDDPRGESCVLAEDVTPAFGQFARECGTAPRNSGIRGLPPGLDLTAEMIRVLAARGMMLTSELDEQGLQVAAITSARETHVVSVDEVSICSPFPPHRPALGDCGAHFVGLNAHRLSWTLPDGRNACEETRAHFARLRPSLDRLVGIDDSRERVVAL